MSIRSDAVAGGLWWQRRFTIVLLCSAGLFLCYIDRVNISVASIAMQESLGWSETTEGWVLSSFFIGYMLFQVPSGWLANRWGGKIVLGAAVVWWSLFTMLTPVAATISIPVLIAARIALGLGEAATFPAAYNLYGRWVPASERARSVSALSGAIPLGTLFALTTTGWIVERWNWEAVFYLFGAAGFVWFAAWHFLCHADPRTDPRISASEAALLASATSGVRTTTEPVPWGKLLSTPAVWALVVNHFCSNWGFYMLLAWLPSYFKGALGLSILDAGIYSAAPWLSMFTVAIAAGIVSDKLANAGIDRTLLRKVFQVTGLTGSAIFLFIAMDVDTPGTALGIMCGALGFLALTLVGFVPNHLDIAPRYADILVGVTNTVGTLPGVLGVVITGWLLDTTGSYASPFMLAAGIQLFGAVVWALFARAKPIIS